MNPHSPTHEWLQSVAGDHGYDSEPDVGETGEITLERGVEKYEVTVERVE